MGAPILELPKVPFKADGLKHTLVNGCEVWQLPLNMAEVSAVVQVAVVSKGNPHAVQIVDNVDTAPVLTNGPLIENHATFPNRVNAGFMQILNRNAVRLRVYERGAGETLACGTGACAAVVAGIRMGLLNPTVDVQTHGGTLTIEWQGLAKNDLSQAVYMTGPATSVFEGEIDVPNLL
jgi:diaminopimelate epimerase